MRFILIISLFISYIAKGQIISDTTYFEDGQGGWIKVVTYKNSTTTTFIPKSDTLVVIPTSTKLKDSMAIARGLVALKANISDPTFTGATRTTGSLGYSGAATGGAVSQTGNKSNAVTLNKICGQITMVNSALAAAAEVSFTVNNNLVASTDVVIVNIQSVGTVGSYLICVSAVGAGSFAISLSNVSAGSLSQAIIINFFVLKSVNN